MTLCEVLVTLPEVSATRGAMSAPILWMSVTPRPVSATLRRVPVTFRGVSVVGGAMPVPTFSMSATLRGPTGRACGLPAALGASPSRLWARLPRLGATRLDVLPRVPVRAVAPPMPERDERARLSFLLLRSSASVAIAGVKPPKTGFLGRARYAPPVSSYTLREANRGREWKMIRGKSSGPMRPVDVRADDREVA